MSGATSNWICRRGWNCWAIERSGGGHGFEIKFPLPDSCRCEKCGHDTAAALECLGKLTPEQRAAVEGINNKARVITKRCYGVKSSDTLWNRLILDLNRASDAVGRSIGELREMVSRLKAVFLAFCT